MALRLHNTLTRSKEEFRPLDPEGRKVSFYNCGPTVYGPFHIGNARTFVCMDVVRRWLVQSGYEVSYVQNITDVDDKIIRRANEEGVSADVIAKRYTKLFYQHLALLGNLPATRHPLATEFIGQMVDFIAELIREGHAYASADGSVWFEVSTYADYGHLSRRPLDQMAEGERVSAEQQAMKRNPLDFALWKSAKPGEPAWDSPWGKGRPGWHIECSVMAIACLGSTLDIHAGGIDLQFPHHENEVAQSECLGHKPFARYWLHNGFLNIDGEKMSKSLGNVFTMDQVFAKMDRLTVRLFLISAHYRAPQDLTDDALHAAKSASKRLLEADREAVKLLAGHSADADWKHDDEVAKFEALFNAAMDDDINTPEAVGAIFQLVTLVNTRRAAAEKDASQIPALARARELLRHLRGVLGLTPDLEPVETGLGDDGLSEKLLAILIDARAEARAAKQFAIGDMIRKRLTDAGIALEDKPGGTVWKKIDSSP